VVYLTGGRGGPDADEARRLTARAIAIEDRPLRRIVAREDRLTGCELGDGTVLTLDALFLAPRPLPRDELLRALGAETEERLGAPWVAVDAAGRTSVPRVWAAGNVVDALATVPLAIAAGAAAAIAINGELVEEDVARAVAAARSPA
jgi:thioredoxin reductase